MPHKNRYFNLEKLPYEFDTLEPYISAKTVEIHYTKHHQAYCDNLDNLVSEEHYQYQNLPLEEVIRRSYKNQDTSVFNNAGQVYNHTFYWKCMQKDGGNEPKGFIAKRIKDNFGGYDVFRKEFIENGKTLFGSGWVWLVESGDKLEILKSSNAGNPLYLEKKTPLLTCDVWEHAYYLDYQNKRVDYVEIFLDKLINWDFVEEQLDNKSS